MPPCWRHLWTAASTAAPAATADVAAFSFLAPAAGIQATEMVALADDAAVGKTTCTESGKLLQEEQATEDTKCAFEAKAKG